MQNVILAAALITLLFSFYRLQHITGLFSSECTTDSHTGRLLAFLLLQGGSELQNIFQC